MTFMNPVELQLTANKSIACVAWIALTAEVAFSIYAHSIVITSMERWNQALIYICRGIE